jgi:hypothetical protein
MTLGFTHLLIDIRARSSWGCKVLAARNADKLTAICEPTVEQMWEPRRITTLWACTSCYKDSFAFSLCIALLIVIQ